jgi:uncharacterized membrane protein
MKLWKNILVFPMAGIYLTAGTLHFLRPDVFLDILPPYLPWHAALVYLSGAAEIILGLLVLIPAARAYAAWGLIALLIAVFPANIHMAVNPRDFPDIPAWGLCLRLPVQFLLIAWAWWYTRPEASNNRDAKT